MKIAALVALWMALASMVFSSPTEYNFLVIGDWGGQPTPPYAEPGQIACAKSMGPVATDIQSQMVLALGDNFYFNGVPSDEHDPRFQETFEKVYTASSLMTPWYLIAGNHDHLGNITAQVAYTKYSKRWNYPDLYYTFTVNLPFNQMTAQFILIDTVVLSGESYHDEKRNIFVKAIGPKDARAAETQWQFIQKALEQSTADYLFVGGHYPIYSACEHGNTDILLQKLRPMMVAANATAYLSGHDHCLEYIQDAELPYILSGSADDCCYKLTNAGGIPKGALKFQLSNQNQGLAIGGYVTMSLNATGATAQYRDQDGKVLFTTPSLPPRQKAAL